MATSIQIFKKIGKVIGWIMLSLLLIVVGILVFINTNSGKKVVKNKVEKYLSNKLHSTVSIGNVDYSLPKWLEIKNVYIEDQKKDTLLFGEELSVDVDMIKLIKGNTDINKIFLKNIAIHVSRSENDTLFNYQFILDAFTGNKKTTINKDTAEMKLTLSKLIFDNVNLTFKDSLIGNNFNASIKNLELVTYKFQPDRSNFGIDDLTASNVIFYMKNYKKVTPAKEATFMDSSASSPYKLFINAKNINLKYIDVLIDNKISGMYYANNIATLSGKNILYSIAQEKATAEKLLLDSAFINFVMPTTVKDSNANSNKKSEPNLWVYAAKQLDIQNSIIKYDDNNKPKTKGLDFSHIDAKNIKVNVSDFNFSTNNTKAALSQFAFADKSGFYLDTTHAKILFTDTALLVTELYAKLPQSIIQSDIELTYDSVAAITKSPLNTFLKANINNASIAFNDIYLLAPALEKSFPKAAFAGQYLNINTVVTGNLQRLYFPFLQLSGLSGTTVNAKGTVYNVTDAKNISFDLAFEQSRIFKKDLLKFVPPTNQQALANLPDIITIKGKLIGDKNNILADVQTNATDFAFTGKVNLKNYSDPTKLQFTIDAQNASFSKNIIVGFLPPTLLETISLPQQISAAGKLNGDKNNITTDLKVSSSYGKLNIKGFIKNIKEPKQANYNLQIITPGFAIGKLIKQDTVLGYVEGTFVAKGTGFDYKTMNTSIKADVASIGYNKYDYKKLLVNADLNNGNVKSIGKINDNNIKLSYNLTANVANKYPTVNAIIRIDTAQLNPLHFTKDTVNFSVSAVVNALNLQPRNLNASLFLDSLRLQNGKNRYQLDSTSLIATSENGIDSIVLMAPFANVQAGGAFDYDKIAVSLQQYINGYYKLPGYKPTYKNIPNQQFAVRGIIRQSPIITSFLPKLVAFDDINFNGSYASANTDSALNFNATLPKIIYATNRISNTVININAKNAKLNYSASFDTLTTISNAFYASSVGGAVAKDSVSFTALTKDINNRNWFGLGANAFVNQNNYFFRLQDSLTLNYEKWKVAPDNLITYSPAGIIINNFLISSDTASIAIKSQQLFPDSPIDIDINNFNLKSISSIVNKDTVFIAGVLDMKANVSDFKKSLPSFTGNATVTHLQFKQNALGNISFNAQKVSDNNVAADLTLIGFGNDVAVKGNYYLNDVAKQFDADVQIKKLHFKTLETFSNGQLQNTAGIINGNINIDGKFAEPRWNGALNFDTVQFALTQLGTPYKIDKQKIIFDYPTITFPRFTITDTTNNSMVLDGNIVSKSIMNYDVGLNITAKDFVVVNAKKAINSQVYGYAAVDVDVAITGNTAFPKIEGEILVNDKSDVKLVLPQSGYTKNDGKTIVRFVDMDTFKFKKPNTGFAPAIIPAAAFAQFLNYNLNIELTKKAALTILIDPSTGDEIKLQGDARLNVGVDPGGNLILAGVYDLDNGYYDLHYEILQRKFNLLKGSTISFAGAPLNSSINITAEYIANTASKDLLSNEVTNVSPTLANSFNQKIPFRVVLYLTGQLNKPIINFDIQLPAESKLISSDLRTTIDNKLAQIRNDPASVNKQVFSLLLFGRFLSEQSSDFFKGNGGGFNDLARQSVSQFLSSALNEIAGDIFKGIDIDLNLNSYNDFSNGGNAQRTDLNVAVSKSFANDRLTVSVGKSFGVEGQDAAAKASGANTGFKPDVTVSYKLTSDGKYMIRAYTKNQFEVTLDGYVVETGVSFLVTMDYEKFNELFRRKKNKK
jgi:TamB, inner membrane protein subunit of TAM complex